MKKTIAIILIIATILTTCATAFAKTNYDPEKPHFVVVAWDPEDPDATMYTTVLTYKNLVKLAKNNCLQEAYELECDGFAPMYWKIAEDGAVTFFYTYTNEPYEEQ